MQIVENTHNIYIPIGTTLNVSQGDEYSQNDDGKLKAKLPNNEASFFNTSQKVTPYATHNATIRGGY